MIWGAWRRSLVMQTPWWSRSMVGRAASQCNCATEVQRSARCWCRRAKFLAVLDACVYSWWWMIDVGTQMSSLSHFNSLSSDITFMVVWCHMPNLIAAMNKTGLTPSLYARLQDTPLESSQAPNSYQGSLSSTLCNLTGNWGNNRVQKMRTDCKKYSESHNSKSMLRQSGLWSWTFKGNERTSWKRLGLY